MADAVPAAPSSFRSWLPVRKWLSLRGWQQCAIVAAVVWVVGDTAKAAILSGPGGRYLIMAGGFTVGLCVLRIGHDFLKYLLDAIVAKETLEKLKQASPQQRTDYFDALYLEECRKALAAMPWKPLVYKQKAETHVETK